MNPIPLIERQLLWLAIGLKLLMWVVVIITLTQAIWEAASGHPAHPPMMRYAVIAFLAALQLSAWLAMFLLRRARLKRGGS